MLSDSDMRMAKFKAALNRCRDGDLGALTGCQITREELITISGLAKATGDAFTYGLTQRLLESVTIGKKS